MFRDMESEGGPSKRRADVYRSHYSKLGQVADDNQIDSRSLLRSFPAEHSVSSFSFLIAYLGDQMTNRFRVVLELLF